MHGDARAESASLPSADQYLHTADARLRFRDEGTGPAVVLLHGWTLDLQMWEPQVAVLRELFRLVRMDRRGFGLSTGVPAPGRDVADLDALCRHLALARAALIGMSQGARTALGFAALAPERVSALILDGPPALDPKSPDNIPISRFRSLVQSQKLESFRREWQQHPLMRLHTHEPAIHRLLQEMLGRYSGKDLLGPAAAVTGGAPPPLGAVTTPALVLTGELDLASRIASADALARRLPCAERGSIAAAGHLPNLDNPSAYNELCRSFITRHLPNPIASRGARHD